MWPILEILLQLRSPLLNYLLISYIDTGTTSEKGYNTVEEKLISGSQNLDHSSLLKGNLLSQYKKSDRRLKKINVHGR